MTQKNDPARQSFLNRPASIDSCRLPPSPFLYPILDSEFSRDILQDAAEVIRAGVEILQIRAKRWTKRHVFDLLSTLKPICLANSTRLVVNDYVDIVMVIEGAGVHLGQEDFPAESCRDILPDRLIGISTHDASQFLAANLQPVDYVALGPIFTSSTKHTNNPPLGIEFVAHAAARKRKPLICIGGIHLENLRELVAAGADGIAVISELYRGSIYDSVSRMLDQLNSR